MSSAVFNTQTESYHVSQIIHVGPISPLPEQLRKENGATHSFLLVTPQFGRYCYYRGEQAAKNARAALGAMLRDFKPSLFGNGFDLLDPARVISFGAVFAYKTPPADGCTHAFTVTLDTAEERHRKVWVRFKTEEGAKRARKALFAAVHTAQGTTVETEESLSTTPEPAAA